MRNLKGCMGIVFVIAVIIGFIGMAAKGCDGACVSSPTKDAAYFQRKEFNDRNMGVKKQQNSNTDDEYYYEKVTCPGCNGIKKIPDLDSNDGEVRVKECPECHGKGFVIVKRQW